MTETVSIIVTDNYGKILLLKRSPHKKWYPEEWDIISGKLKNGESPKECFRRELFEETGINHYKLMENKKPYIYQEEKRQWLVHPYHCVVKQNVVQLDGEHNVYKWVALSKLSDLNITKPAKLELKTFYGLRKMGSGLAF